MKRRIFNALAGISLALCVVIWFRSYRRYDLIRYGLTPHSHPDQVIGGICGWNRGQLILRWFTEPMAYDNYLEHRARTQLIPYLGLHWSTSPTPFAMSWHDLWFHTERFHRMIPVNADGTVAVNSNGNRITNAPLQLPWSLHTAIIPMWLPFLLTGVTAAWPLLSPSARRRRARLAEGRCVSCGYDLRATPDRCPECGQIPQKVKSTL